MFAVSAESPIFKEQREHSGGADLSRKRQEPAQRPHVGFGPFRSVPESTALHQEVSNVVSAHRVGVNLHGFGDLHCFNGNEMEHNTDKQRKTLEETTEPNSLQPLVGFCQRQTS